MFSLLINLATNPINFFSGDLQITLEKLNEKNHDINALCGFLMAKRKRKDKNFSIAYREIVFYAFKKYHHFLVIQNELDHKLGQKNSYVLKIDHGAVTEIHFNDNIVNCLPEKYFNVLDKCIEQYITNKVHLFDFPETFDTNEPQIYTCSKKSDDDLKNISHTVKELSKNHIKDGIIVCGLDLYRIKAINLNQVIEYEKDKEDQEMDDLPLFIDSQTLKLAIQLAKKFKQKNKTP